MEGEAERRCIGLMARQHGLITRAQALRAGLSTKQIRGRLKTRRWGRCADGVYRLMGSPGGWFQNLLLACLRAGEGAAVSHRAAAALWKIDGFESRIVEVTSPRGFQPRDGRIVAHRSPLPAEDIGWLSGIPVTTAARTLVDLGRVADEAAIEDALECCLRRRWVTQQAVRDVLNRPEFIQQPGTRCLRALVEELPEGARPTESRLESRLKRAIREAGLPAPVQQHPVFDGTQWRRLDFAYPAQWVGIEADGRSIHNRKRRWAADHARRNALEALGWTVFVVTSEQLRDDRQTVLDDVGRALRRRSG